LTSLCNKQVTALSLVTSYPFSIGKLSLVLYAIYLAKVTSHLTARDVTGMIGFKRSNRNRGEESLPSQNEDVARLFFDIFSTRLGAFETALKLLSTDVEKLKIASDQSKLSDLVLLERLQESEKILGESLSWIRQMADAVLQPPSNAALRATNEAMTRPSTPATVTESQPISMPQLRHDPSVVQPGSLNSITTPTELQVLTLLANEGPKSAPEIGRFVGRSREHTARLMKKLFDEGYVRRDQSRIPFRYSTVERVKSSFTKPAQKDQEQEVASAPQA
jgi:CRP-like cAMP-binding protein